MKFNFEGYEIEIRAKKENGRYNKKDTQRILNLFSIFADYAASYHRIKNHDALAEEAQEAADSMYELLKAEGYYKK